MMENPQLKLKEPCDIRWRPNNEGVQTIRHILPSLLVSLEREANERNDATSAGLSTFCKGFDFLANVHLLCDALPHLCRLSKCFQAEQLDFTLVQSLVKSSISAISDLGDNPGICMARIKSNLRNRRGRELLDVLMRLSIESQELKKFNFSRSVDHFASSRSRRVNFLSKS